MGWTKRALIAQAFGELALAGYDFDLSPQEQQAALVRMDSMVATWTTRGIRIGYALSASPEDSDLDDESGIPASAAEAVFLNLAIRISSGKGKALASATKKAAREAYETLLWAAATPQEQQLPGTMPLGAGNKGWRNINRPYFPEPDRGPLGVGSDGGLTFNET